MADSDWRMRAKYSEMLWQYSNLDFTYSVCVQSSSFIEIENETDVLFSAGKS